MDISAIRKRCQRGLFFLFAPRLSWQWQQVQQSMPCLSQGYRNCPPPAQRHWRKYLCKPWSMRRRLATLIAHYSQLDCLPAAWAGQLCGHGKVHLCQIPLKSGGSLHLFLEPSSFFKEGELGLYLRNAEGVRMYSLSFTLGTGGQLLIGGLQGPRTTLDEGMVKWLGKEMFGLRPKNLLLTALYALNEQMGRRQLLGISDAAHTFSHKLKSSYDVFWLEAQARPHDGHWYRLPECEPVRDIAEVKSQRRSEFRRREAMREDLVQAIRDSWRKSVEAVQAA